MRKLEEKLNNRIAELSATKFPNEKDFMFFKGIVNVLNSENEVSHESNHVVIKSRTINPIGILIACYLSVNENASFEQVRDEIENNKDLIDKYVRHLNQHMDFLTLEFDLSYFKNSIFEEERYQKILQKSFKLVLYYSSNASLLCEALTTSKRDNNILHSSVKQVLNVDETFNLIIRKYKSLSKEYSEFKNKIEDEINAMQNILTNFSREYQKKIPATIDKNMINKINDDELKYEIYRVISSYNNNFFIDVLKENRKLKINNISYIKYLFKVMGQNIDNADDECIKLIQKFGSIENISQILNALKTSDHHIINFNHKDGIVALINTNEHNIYFIIDLLKKGIISSEFVLNNPSILYDKNIITGVDGLYKRLVINYNVLSKNGFNLTTLLNEALLMDDINDFINTFNNYGLNKNCPLPKEITNKNFFTHIDLFIELGLNEFIIDNFSILNNSSLDIIKRIIISKKMHLQIFDDDNNLLPSILTGNNFYVKNDCLDNFIIDECHNILNKDICELLNNIGNTDYEIDDNIKLLDNFKENDNVYLFDSIIISRNKVLRNYSFLTNNFNYDDKELLKISCLFNSILDIEDINIITNKIDDILNMKNTKIKSLK